MILFRYRDPRTPPEYPKCSRILTEQGQKLWAPPDEIMNPSHGDPSTVNTSAWYHSQAAQGHTPTLHLDPPLSYSLAFKSTDTETTLLWKAHCGTGS